MDYLSHWTAATYYRIEGLPEPLQKRMGSFTFHYTVRTAGQRGKNTMIKYHVCSVDLPDGAFLVDQHGEGIVSPELLFFQLCNYSQDIHDAMVIACHMVSPINGRPPLTSIQKLWDFIQQVHYLRGMVRGKDALQHIIENFKSPAEVAGYLKIKLPNSLGGCGYNGELEANKELYIEDEDRDKLGQPTNLLYPDLIDVENKLIIEYDGKEFHSTPEQIERDEKRRAIFMKMGYYVIVLDKDNLYKPMNFIAIHWELFEFMDRDLVINAGKYKTGLRRLQELLPRAYDPLTPEQREKEINRYCAWIGYRPRVR